MLVFPDLSEHYSSAPMMHSMTYLPMMHSMKYAPMMNSVPN